MALTAAATAGGGAPASAAAAPTPPTRYFIAAVVSGYFVTSIAMVFLSKLLLDPASSVEAPFFITGFQAACTAGISYAVGRGMGAAPAAKPFPRLSAKLLRELLPLSFMFVGMIAFNNLALKHVEVSFYNVARSLTVVFNVIFTYLLLGERTAPRTLATLLVVIVGFLLGSGTEVRFSAVGTFYGVLSSAFVSLNSIFTKKAMALVDGNQYALAAYNNVNAVLIFAAISAAAGEPAELLAAPAADTPSFWGLLCLSGVMGFAIGIMTVLQIKVTSPLTHNISGTAKAGVQTVLALYIWRNPTTPANLAGTALVLVGSFLYAVERTREMDARAKAAAAVATTVVASTAAAPSGSSDRAIGDGDDDGDEDAPGATAVASAAGAVLEKQGLLRRTSSSAGPSRSASPAVGLVGGGGGASAAGGGGSGGGGTGGAS
jgi:solute carrier family 35 (GDP-fucose transporter), member C1